MTYIKKMVIEGFKKFKSFEIEFNKDMNVLVGENEVGKSSILEAIDLTLNQRLYKLLDGGSEQLFNLENIDLFKSNPKIENLPSITIELHLNMDSEIPISKEHFTGLDYIGGNRIQEFEAGVKFLYHFDSDFETDFHEINFIENDSLPLELYKFEWCTFQGGPFKKQKNPIKSLLIDNSISKNDLYGSYAKQIYENKIDANAKRNLSYKLKNRINSFLNEEADALKIGKQTIGIDDRKSTLSRIIDIKENKISIQNMGKGRENIIKTEIALQVDANLILVEEPENHLSHSNTKKLIEMIKSEPTQSQIIVTTHNPLVISRLNIKNTIWVNDIKPLSLKNVDRKAANFFEKADNLNLLEFILSEKVILVEGATEYIYIPLFFNINFHKNIDTSGIHVISMSGITYKNYIEIAKKINKKLLIITDNDGSQKKISEIELLNDEFKEKGFEIQIVCDKSTDNSTFEKVLYNENELVLKQYKENSKVTTEYKGETIKNKALAYMLKNKADSAIEITTEDTYKENLSVPKYIREGLIWLDE